MAVKSAARIRSLVAVCILACAPLYGTMALDNGLGLTPAMGYNSWYDLFMDVDEATMRVTAQAMIELGFTDAGYTYLNLDDGWAGNRTADGTLTATGAFTGNSLKSLADFAHAHGMKLGTYTDRGTQTCGGRPGAQDHETQDAATYASWGVDYLKEDSCHASTDHNVAFKQYGLMRDALNATGRPILFSLCGWNSWYAPVGKSLGNSWRIGPDDSNWGGVLTNINDNAGLAQYAGPGGFNDPCLLLSTDKNNNFVMTEQQSRAQFTMWAIMAAPLLISGNIRNMSAFNVATYTNKDVIAISQDSLGLQGIRIAGENLSSSASESTNVWARKLSDGDVAVAFLNTGTTAANVSCDAACFGKAGIAANASYSVVDVWTAEQLPDLSGATFTSLSLPATGGHQLIRLSPSS